MQAELSKLSADLSSLHITDEQVLQRISGFQTDHAEDISKLAGEIKGMLKKGCNEKDQQTSRLIRRSLDFEQLQERQLSVHTAAANTFQWIFEPQLQNSETQHFFPAWLALKGQVSNIFWVCGKAACGKSTLMQYLFQRFDDMHGYLSYWTGVRELSVAHCFFWNAGNRLQKSLHGLLRSLLFQLLETRLPDIRNLVQPQVWADAFTEGITALHWSNQALLKLLTTITERNPTGECFFLFIDGLDEFEGSDQDKEQMITILQSLASAENVKICASSRPWNIFFDAFGNCLQLRVEDFTAYDIQTYIKGQLLQSRYFQSIIGNDYVMAEHLISQIAQKADGVFLWVQIVVSQLISGIRDGDDVQTMLKRLRDIPEDIEDLFECMFNSIEKRYLRESSVLFQVMLHVRDCAADKKQTLIDLSYLDLDDPNFVLADNFHPPSQQNHIEYNTRLDRAARKLNSRSMGLLETRYRPSIYCGEAQVSNFDNPDSVLTVNFLHRTASDFFALDRVQKKLQDLSKGPFKVRSFCCNTLVLSLLQNVDANSSLQVHSRHVNVVDSLVKHSTKEGDGEEICNNGFLSMVEEILRSAVNVYNGSGQDDVSNEIYACWERYNNDLLTTAIQYGQFEYVKRVLTRRMVESRTGRPYLDYALWYQPQLNEDCNDRIRLLQHILSLGADPNEMFEGRSLWHTFLSLVTRKWSYPAHVYIRFASEAIKLMVMHGANMNDRISKLLYERAIESQE